MEDKVLTITSAQFGIIQRAREAEYDRDLMKSCAARAPEILAVLGQAEFERRLRIATHRGRIYGLKTTDGFTLLAALVLGGGPAFADNPKVARLMHGPGASPDAKMRKLAERVIARINARELRKRST